MGLSCASRLSVSDGFRNVQRFRGGLVFMAHRLLYHSTLGLRVIKTKKKDDEYVPTREVRSGLWFSSKGFGDWVYGFLGQGLRFGACGFGDGAQS